MKRLLDMEIAQNDVFWLGNFLSGRSQCTKHGTQLSDFLPLFNGTPQGTKLAIILFICLVDSLLEDFDQKHNPKRNIMNAFVDDIVIAEAVKLVVNPNKSNVIIIDKSKSKKFSDFNVIVNDVLIPKVNCCKLLGVHINTNADWSDHVTKIYSKASSKLYILRRLNCCGFLMCQLKLLYTMHKS